MNAEKDGSRVTRVQCNTIETEQGVKSYGSEDKRRGKLGDEIWES